MGGARHRPFKLAASLDVAALAAQFASEGRVQVPAVLADDGAARLHRHLASELAWTLIFNHGHQLYELDEAARARLDARQLMDLVRAAHNTSRQGFQYLFENVRVPEPGEQRRAAPGLLARFADFLNDTPFLDFARRVTHTPEISFADAQATCYRQGHFLTTHDDLVAGKNRIAAYVFSLTPDWQPEWGGQLQFIGERGHAVEGWVPRFNVLNLVRVPQPHLVSCVTPLAGDAARYSITGWLRHGMPP